MAGRQCRARRVHIPRRTAGKRQARLSLRVIGAGGKSRPEACGSLGKPERGQHAGQRCECRSRGRHSGLAPQESIELSSEGWATATSLGNAVPFAPAANTRGLGLRHPPGVEVCCQQMRAVPPHRPVHWNEQADRPIRRQAPVLADRAGNTFQRFSIFGCGGNRLGSRVDRTPQGLRFRRGRAWMTGDS